jgi:hypothetical protein
VNIGHGVEETVAVAGAVNRCAFPYNAAFASDAETELAEGDFLGKQKKVYFTMGKRATGGPEVCLVVST